MPRQTFVPTATELIREMGFEDGILAHDEHDWESNMALDELCATLSGLYGTSPAATEIHLRQLNLVMHIYVYKELKAQTAISC